MDRRIDEAELLAWIEDELPAERRAALEQALAQDPVLLQWARGARRDRDLLRRAGVAAPAGLVEDAIARAEREALVGAQAGAQTPAVVGRITVARRFALAAAIVIAVGGVATLPFVLNQSGFRGGAQPGPQQPLAMRRADAPPSQKLAEQRDAVVADARQAGAASDKPAANGMVALNAPTPLQTPDILTDSAPVVAKADEAIGPPRTDADRRGGAGAAPSTAEPSLGAEREGPAAPAALAPVAKEAPIAPADAVRLAQEGRLVILVRASDVGAVEKLIAPGAAAAPPATMGPPERRSLPQPLRQLAGSAGDDARVYRLALALDPMVVEDLRAALARVGVEARFVRASSPLPADIAVDGVGVWWMEPVSRWRQHGSVPVLVVPAGPESRPTATP